MRGCATAIRSKPGERRVLSDCTQEPMCLKVGWTQQGRARGSDRRDGILATK